MNGPYFLQLVWGLWSHSLHSRCSWRYLVVLGKVLECDELVWLKMCWWRVAEAPKGVPVNNYKISINVLLINHLYLVKVSLSIYFEDLINNLPEQIWQILLIFVDQIGGHWPLPILLNTSHRPGKAYVPTRNR